MREPKFLPGQRVGRTMAYVKGLAEWGLDTLKGVDKGGKVVEVLPTGYLRVLWDGADKPQITSPRILTRLSD